MSDLPASVAAMRRPIMPMTVPMTPPATPPGEGEQQDQQQRKEGKEVPVFAWGGRSMRQEHPDDERHDQRDHRKARREIEVVMLPPIAPARLEPGFPLRIGLG